MKQVMDRVIKEAKREGKFDKGIQQASHREKNNINQTTVQNKNQQIFPLLTSLCSPPPNQDKKNNPLLSAHKQTLPLPPKK